MLSFLCVIPLCLPLPQSTPQEGLTLFSPTWSNDAHLLDEDKNLVHTWSDHSRPGLGCYLQPNGNLLRTYKTAAPGAGHLGGVGGGVHEMNWEGQVLWDYQLATATEHLHHDVERLPNGNILMIAWEDKTEAAAIAAGRDPLTVNHAQFWSEQILELDPTTGTIVWEWHLWNHIVQDFDPGAPNFGVVADHPQRVNLNYPPTIPSGGDWVHINSVDYNAEFDQIVLSSRFHHELWVIDHSTTTAQAATSSGGNSGKGGDLLYRWGNPQAYDRGTANDQVFFGQHDAQWVPDGYPGEGNFLVYNNGINRPGGNRSSVDELQSPMDALGNYPLLPGQAFEPTGLFWTYDGGLTNPFISHHTSGMERQPNGNTLICDGPAGRLFEVDQNHNVVWDWTNIYPFGNRNGIFKVRRYQHWLWPNSDTFSASVANTIDIDLVAGADRAHEDYQLLANRAGIDIGVTLNGGMHLPLNHDDFMQRVYRNSNSASFQNFAGQLDADGKATATFNSFGAISPSLVGTTLHFAYVLGDPMTGVVDFVSNPVAIEIIP
ncbi:MAG: hypothetical protein GY879_08150 [Planctomycetes bacterium]|nr:hypothetical protein [Planctomycetota bacterium]MCP4861804.1 hypothetical protein [Planctomycetota bacterium]